MSIIKKVIKAYNDKGIYGVKKVLKNKFLMPNIKSITDFKLYKKYFDNKNGIEIGGLSGVFNQEIPIYKIINNLDGCNFSNQTVWEGALKQGKNYNFFKSKTGYQYLCEASDLRDVESEKYDFIISSHCLEHCANTLKTVQEWLRVIKKGGAILLVLPDKDYTFDHNREVTKFEHLIEDFKNNVDEKDLTHLEEILNLHDLEMDIVKTKEEFKNRCLDNYNNRCLHQHIFDFELLIKIFKYFDIEIINTQFVKPYHQIILGVKK